MSLYRYKLELNVVDNTNLNTFIMFGAEAENLVEGNAPTLIQKIKQRVLITEP